MTLTLETLPAILVLAGVAAYVQTLTGFAFGLLMMGGVGILGLLSLQDAAVVVSVLTLVNATQVLARGWRDIAWPEFKLIIPASTVGLFLGYWLLEQMAASSMELVRLTLGLVIIVSSIQLWLQPHPLPVRSPPISFALFGSLAGLMGGLFSTSGPPLIYHLYRQPFAFVSIRETLVGVFAANAVMRIGMVAASGDMPPPSIWWALFAVPVVAGATYAAKRWPPALSPLAMRRAAFFLLFLSGASLAFPMLISFVGEAFPAGG